MEVRKSKEHLYEVDLMRAFIILGVTCVHIISFYNLFAPQLSATNLVFGALLSGFHFTREAFMYISGLVLFITYYRKPFKAVDFWRKRFTLIVIPYVVFTVIYIVFTGLYLKGFQWTWGNLGSDVFWSLLFGKQFYLYFLVVSMQLYIVFPVFVGFMRRMERYHWQIFIGSFLLEIGIMAFNRFYLQNLPMSHLHGILYLLDQYRDRNIVTYQFWFVAGAVVAAQYGKIRPFLAKHGRLVLWSLTGMTLALWLHYLLDALVFHRDQTMSVLVLQPIMIPFSLIVTVALCYAGIRWSAVRLKPRMLWFSSFVKTAAAASFGIFLLHPLLLHYAEQAVYAMHPSAVMRAFLLPVTVVFVYGGAMIIVRWISKVPLLSYIVGQKTDPPRWLAGRSASVTTN